MIFLEDQRGPRELLLDRQNSDAKFVKRKAELRAKKAEGKQATLEKRKRKRFLELTALRFVFVCAIKGFVWLVRLVQSFFEKCS